MNTDIRIHIEFFDHAKTRRMLRVLGPWGPLSLLRLWAYAAKNRPDGTLAGMDSEDIEDRSGWSIDQPERRGEFFAYITKNGWLDRVNRSTWKIHEWEVYNPWAAEAEARSRDGRHGAHMKHHVRKGVSRPRTCEFCRGALGGLQGGLEGAQSDPSRDGSYAPSAPSPSPFPSPAPVAEKERETTTNARARVTPETESFLRMKVREIRLNTALLEMAIHEPDDYVEAVKDLTGYTPDTLADILGDESIRPQRRAS